MQCTVCKKTINIVFHYSSLSLLSCKLLVFNTTLSGAHLLRFLLELLNCSLVNATTFVDQMTGGRRLA